MPKTKVKQSNELPIPKQGGHNARYNSRTQQ